MGARQLRRGNGVPWLLVQLFLSFLAQGTYYGESDLSVGLVLSLLTCVGWNGLAMAVSWPWRARSTCDNDDCVPEFLGLAQWCLGLVSARACARSVRCQRCSLVPS
jgi:hypothetical protein